MARRFSLSDLEHPIVQAPMAGGPSTPELAAAVSQAGGLGFLAAGYKAPDAVRSDVAAVRERTDRPFGVNLFAPPGAAPDPAAVARYARALGPEAERYGAAVGEARHDDDGWEEKLALVAAEGVAVVSFTFGCPPGDVVVALHDAGAAVWVTVTTDAEAVLARDAGADALVVQGVEAGGHRGSFADDAPGEIGLLALLALVAGAVDLPLVATGGLATGRSIAGVLAAGAAAAQLGSALMLAPEAATSPALREALRQRRPTALTRAFTGRTARGIVNRFLSEHGADAPSGYPDVHHLTAPLRAAARERGDAEAVNLWAGQAHALARERPAGELVRVLADDARAALREAADRAGA
ncbi:MAG: nitronate monooxygenase [Solirubrobacteraceae bacterium]|jgi:nitronate monooxygenase|nr:nitronate monooxygenase [Solirubrobacteraceae bacterium]MEA2360048.1 nitronate monooxygenase [Solirubrobacteraceae bacterium]MEA2396075.1 nitronate monooxygenase [Solirubrobacteraceae bacterium]